MTQELESRCRRRCTELVRCQPHLLWSLGPVREEMEGGGGGNLVVAVKIIIVQCICKLVMIEAHNMLITCSSWNTTIG